MDVCIDPVAVVAHERGDGTVKVQVFAKYEIASLQWCRTYRCACIVQGSLLGAHVDLWRAGDRLGTAIARIRGTQIGKDGFEVRVDLSPGDVEGEHVSVMVCGTVHVHT